MVGSLLGVFVLAVVVSAVLVPVSMAIAARLGAVDRPGHLKPHERPTPILGGTAIFATVAIVGLLGIWVLPSAGGSTALSLTTLIAAATVLCSFGAFDDLRVPDARAKLSLEVVLAILAMVCITLTEPDLPWWFVPVGVLWMVGLVNAVNMLDGLDGLAGSLGVIAGAGIAVAAVLAGDPGSARVAGALAGAALGFLFYNRPRAKVFMGDNGSLPLGFMLAGLVIIVASGARPADSTVAIGLGTAVMLGVPVADMVLAIARRALGGKPVFDGDRGHVYDQLRDRFRHSVPVTLAIVCGANVVFAAIGLAITRMSLPLAVLGTAATVVATALVLILSGFLRRES